MKVFSAAACLRHAPGPGHPEAPGRLAAVLDTLATTGIAVHEAPPATIDQLLSCHPHAHLDAIRELATRGGGSLDADTHVGRYTWDAIVGAAGAAIAATEHTLTTGVDTFAAIRPPGHHALAEQAMGFCFVGHAAVAAARAHAADRDRVLIVDWDVHHGNGTQALVEHDPRTRFVSMHQWPWYPGTGAADDRGAVGNCWNVPMPPGMPRGAYVEALWGAVSAATDDWTPEVVVISAGYDGLAGDPLGGFTLEPEDCATWISRLHTAFPNAPLVAIMEGGYDPGRLAAGVLATVHTEPGTENGGAAEPSTPG